MTNTPIAAKVEQALDIQLNRPSQVAFDWKLGYFRPKFV
jgi:hypothetical protein